MRHHIISSIIRIILKKSNFKIIQHYQPFNDEPATLIFKDKKNGNVYVNQIWKVKSEFEVPEYENRIQEYFKKG